MAPRAFWKGYLKFSLVSCAVAMTPATSDRGRVRFHTLNAESGNRVQSRYVDTATGKPVEDDDQVKGYPVAEDSFVTLEDEELEAFALESTRTIDIETFVPRDSIGWIWLDQPYYLVPDDKPGEEAFAVIREAMRATETAGIARLVLFRRERAVMVEPCGKGLLVWTLRYGDEVREPEGNFQGVGKSKPDKAALNLIGRLIDARRVEWSDDLVKDPVQEALVSTIESKQKPGKSKGKRKATGPEPTGGNVVSIMDALRKSVESEAGRKKR
jgi:DNA end-binding protein Ku